MNRAIVSGWIVALGTAAALATSSFAPARDPEGAADAAAGVGAPKLARAYGRWAQAHEAAGGDREVRIGLAYRPGLSRAPTAAHGSVRLDLLDGHVEAQVSGLPAGEFELWLVDNRGGERGSVRPEPSDVQIRVGRLARSAADARLVAELGPRALDGLELDLAVIAPAGASAADGLLYGSAPLFQRLYTRLRTQASDLDAPTAPGPGLLERWFGGSLARASAAPPSDAQLLARLIARGERLFTEETFGGNGRTCATCHPLEHNTTLGVSDIAGLPDRDPLFVAEFDSQLAFRADGPKFEVPLLMRGAALILENVDGREDLAHKFVMRSISHTLALSTSLDPQDGDGSSVPPEQRTGWGGDGAPGNGTLRDFATGAVEQHFTRRLERVPGRDFRLPTDEELDALEAFQLSLGRQEEVQFPIAFRNAVVSRGQQLFFARGPVGAGNCGVCHVNAGARSLGPTGEVANNFIFDTGVERQVDRPAALILQGARLDLAPTVPGKILPPDGGFGKEGDPTNTELGPGGGEGSVATGFGNSGFNTPPVVEAADTPPFFHDNSIRTIEGAVEFYNSEAFRTAFSNVPTHLETTQVEAIAAFLRALNALENLRSTRELLQALADCSERERARRADSLLRRALAESSDAIEVLAGAELVPETVSALRRVREQIARLDARRPRALRAALDAIDQARATLVAD